MNIATYNEYFVKLPFTFDIAELRKSTYIVRNIARAVIGQDFNGTSTLCLTHKKNGDPWEGQKIRGFYWTRPDDSYEEVTREDPFAETEFTEFNQHFKNTYFASIHKFLTKKYKIGRMRLMMLKPRSTISWHRDPDKRIHIPITSNAGCRHIIEDEVKHIPADGRAWIHDDTKYHTVTNGGETPRVSLVTTLLN